jgi:bifunctional non-homologous end joining protein LigD
VGNVTIPANHALPKVGDLVEVRYLYHYPGGSLYQPIYLGSRSDKDLPDHLNTLKSKPLAVDDES